MMRPIFRTILLCAAFFGLAASADAQTYEKLYSFPDGPGGAGPAAPLIQAADGFFYGTTEYGGESGGPYPCGTAFRTDGTSTPTTLHSFTFDEGCNPTAALLQGSDGLFYGVARGGGRLANGDPGEGTIFTMDSNGTVAVLHVFESLAVDNGGFPYAALIQATDGLFYGTTRGGGAHFQGTVFKISASGEFTLLHSFDPSSGGGAQPYAPLIQATDGMFYGTTVAGGNPCGEEACDRFPGGTVFQMDASGNVSYRFNFYIGGGNGDSPFAGLIQTSPTTFMGTTSNLGGLESELSEFAGSIFVLDTSPDWYGLYTVHQFELILPGLPGGGVPVGELTQTSDGNIYGTTMLGGGLGGFAGQGVVFRRNTAGEVEVLHAFDGDNTDGDAGALPGASLLKGTDGNLYGTAAGENLNYGGSVSPGTLFRLNFAPARTDQTITFAALADKTFGDPDFSIGATASSALTVSFTPSGNCTMSGVIVHLTGAGSCTITADQAGDASYNPAPSVPRSFTIAVAPKLTLSLSPAFTTGGSTVTGTVTLTAPAPAGGAIVSLTSDTPGAATIPATISIAKGKTTKTFTVTTLAVASATPVTISASYGGTTAWSGLTVNPPALSGLTLAPAAGVKGGTPASAKVTLNGPAPAGGLLVTLTSAKPAVAASTSVVVPAGAKTATVAITTFNVTTNTTVDITATGGGASKSATLSVKR